MMVATGQIDGEPQVPDETSLLFVDEDLIRLHGLFAILTLLVSGFFGALVALKFVFPDFLSSHVATTWGLLRYNHTQGILFGWLGNAFLAFLYHVTPRLSGQPVTSRKLGFVLFALWNFGIVLPGWALIEANLPQVWLAIKPLEWTEFPLGINLVTELCLALVAVQFVWPYLRPGLVTGHEALYVSAWYIIGGTVFTFLSFPTGSVVPLVEPGAIGAAFSGLWIHDAVGLFVTPFVVATAYWVIPAATGAAYLQPLPVDDRVLGPVLHLSAQRHPPLCLLGDPDGHAARGDRRLGDPWARRPARRLQPTDVVSRRLGDREARRAAALRLHWRRVLPRRQRAGLGAGLDGDAAPHPFHRLGDRPLASGDARLRHLHRRRRPRPRLAANGGHALPRRLDGRRVLAAARRACS